MVLVGTASMTPWYTLKCIPACLNPPCDNRVNSLGKHNSLLLYHTTKSSNKTVNQYGLQESHCFTVASLTVSTYRISKVRDAGLIWLNYTHYRTKSSFFYYELLIEQTSWCLLLQPQKKKKKRNNSKKLPPQAYRTQKTLNILYYYIYEGILSVTFHLIIQFLCRSSRALKVWHQMNLFLQSTTVSKYSTVDHVH